MIILKESWMEIVIFFQWLIDLLSNILPVTSAAFFGAGFAFLLQIRHERKKEFVAQVTAGKSAQLVIVTHLNFMKNIKKQWLDPQKNDPNRALTLLPLSNHPKFPQLDLEALSFMLDGDGAELLHELMVSEQTFITLTGTLGMRNTIYIERQSRKAVDGMPVLDLATKQALTDLTNSIYVLTDGTIKNHMEGFDKLKNYIERRFPGVKGLSVEFNY